jgi:hypothetical protein
MSESSDNYQQGGCGGCFGGMLGAFILGWIVYGSFMAGITTTLITLALGLVALIAGVIPVAGPIGYWFVANTWIMPLFPQYGLDFTWLTGLLFWGNLISSILVNIVVIFFLVAKLLRA